MGAEGVTLKVAEALQDEVGYGRGRLDTPTRNELGLSIGDIGCLATGREARCLGCIQDMPTASQVNHAAPQVHWGQAKTGSLKGRGLKAGDVVTTGSWNGVHFAKAGTKARVEFPGLGQADMQFG